MDTSTMDQVDNSFISFLVFIAQVLSQEDEQLPPDSFISVHIPNIFKFWFSCKKKEEYVLEEHIKITHRLDHTAHPRCEYHYYYNWPQDPQEDTNLL